MKEVSLFVPCLVDTLFPAIGEAVYALLKRLGLRVTYHEHQTCCGQPAVNAGYWDEARETARRFIRVFGEDECVVSPSGSCVLTVKEHYKMLLADDPEWSARADALSGRVYELSQFLVDVLGVEDVGASFEGKAAYHESCQLLRGLGVSEQPKALIRASSGTELTPLNDAHVCCGFGGEFSVKYPGISEGMVRDKVTNYLNSGADLLIVSEPGCLMNIQGYLKRHHPEKPVTHIANFLAGHGLEG